MPGGVRTVAQRIIDIDARVRDFESTPPTPAPGIPASSEAMNELEKLAARVTRIKPHIASLHEFFPHYNNTVTKTKEAGEYIARKVLCYAVRFKKNKCGFSCHGVCLN